MTDGQMLAFILKMNQNTETTEKNFDHLKREIEELKARIKALENLNPMAVLGEMTK